MVMTPEARVSIEIDSKRDTAGWAPQNLKQLNLSTDVGGYA